MPVVAYIPLHISSMWSPVYDADELKTGSVGAGVLLWPGVKVSLRRGDKLPHVDAVLRRLGISVEASYSSPVEPGRGYGVSGAVSLGTALAAAAAAGRPLLEAAQAAHVVEVAMGTGLGDVVAQFHGGGIEARVKPGAPGVGFVDRVPHPAGLVALVHEYGREETPSMLRRLAGFLSSEGRRIVEKFLKEPTYEAFLKYSAEFSRRAGFLTQDVEAEISACRRLVEGYYAKKGVLVALAYKDVAEEAVQCLRGVGLSVRLFRLAHSGALVFRSSPRTRP
ncbi:MAG: pantothenate kinase [Pyrobaculum sp.]